MDSLTLSSPPINDHLKTKKEIITLYAVLGEKRKQSLTIFPVVTQDGGRDSWDLAAGDAPTGA